MVLGIFVALVVLFIILPLVGVALFWVLSTAIVGIVLGGLARLIIPGRQPIGLLATIVCGWVGSLIGGGISHAIWHHQHHLATLLIEIAVSAVAVLVWSGHNRRAIGSSTPHRVIDI